MAGRWLERIGLVLAVALVVVLARQNASLREGASRILRDVTEPQVGMYLPSIEARALDGSQVGIGLPPEGAAQVLYFSLTGCEYCQASTPRVRELARELDGQMQPSSFEPFVAISIDSIRPSLSTLTYQGVPEPVVHLSSQRIKSLFRAGRVPRLVVVDHEGRVRYARTGVIEDDQVVDSVLVVVEQPGSIDSGQRVGAR